MTLIANLVCQKKFGITFTTPKAKLYLCLHDNGDSRYMYINKTQIHKFKCFDHMTPRLFF